MASSPTIVGPHGIGDSKIRVDAFLECQARTEARGADAIVSCKPLGNGPLWSRTGRRKSKLASVAKSILKSRASDQSGYERILVVDKNWSGGGCERPISAQLRNNIRTLNAHLRHNILKFFTHSCEACGHRKLEWEQCQCLSCSSCSVRRSRKELSVCGWCSKLVCSSITSAIAQERFDENIKLCLWHNIFETQFDEHICLSCANTLRVKCNHCLSWSLQENGQHRRCNDCDKPICSSCTIWLGHERFISMTGSVSRRIGVCPTCASNWSLCSSCVAGGNGRLASRCTAAKHSSWVHNAERSRPCQVCFQTVCEACSPTSMNQLLIRCNQVLDKESVCKKQHHRSVFPTQVSATCGENLEKQLCDGMDLVTACAACFMRAKPYFCSRCLVTISEEFAHEALVAENADNNTLLCRQCCEQSK